jgi:L,D-peptidoglycan transpeptidase YkuD (ErfK/YbiS/YcfS/YnhG family)
MKSAITNLRICVIGMSAQRGRLMIGHRSFACLVGRNGLTFRKREGDGQTPVGDFAIRSLLFRRDRRTRTQTGLAQFETDPRDAWCDEPGHRLYNRKVRLPFKASHEELWRKDTAYDWLAVIDYNLSPRAQGRGSAIFFHVASAESSFTQGCVAVRASDMRKVLQALGPRCVMRVGFVFARRK